MSNSLRLNLSPNSAVQIVPKFPAAQSGNAKIYLEIARMNPSTWSNPIFDNIWGDVEEQKPVEIETTRLVDYIDAEVDFLKLDIEGCGEQVPRDIKPKLNMSRQIEMEFHGTNTSQEVNDLDRIVAPMELLKDIQPLLSLISAVLSITVIGFVIRLSLLMRTALSERTAAVEAQKGIVEERLKLAEDELTRARTNYEREMSSLKDRLSQLLTEGKVSLENLVLQPGSLDIRSEIREAITSTLKTILTLERGAEDLGITEEDAGRHLEIAKALSLEGEWVEAAQHYDTYLETNPADWEAQFARAIAHANRKGDKEANLQALRAYSETIARMPEGIEDNLRARLYSYRGAMLKRLKRIEEAENDLQLARRWATDQYEREDISWNLACVYAMAGEKQKLLAELVNLVHNPTWRELIKSRHWWFGSFLDDPDVKHLLSNTGM